MKTMLCLRSLIAAAAVATAAAQDNATRASRPQDGAQTNATGASRPQGGVTYAVPTLALAQKHTQMIRLAAALIATGFANAKAHGMNIDDYARFAGDQFAPEWRKDAGFEGYVRGVLYSFEGWRTEDDPAIEIISRTDSVVKFKAYNSWLHAYRNGEVMGMTLAEFYRWCDGVSQRIATAVGCRYAQTIEGDYMIITLTKGAAET